MRKNENGQALLLVLLAMAVILTVAMSVVSQSISDVAVTTQEEESLRAFSAAEAGIEESLINNISIESDAITKKVSDDYTAKEVTYTIDASTFPDTSDYVYPSELMSGDSATIWFKPHDANGYLNTDATGYSHPSIRLMWGANTEDTALEVSVWYLAGGSGPLTVKRIILDPGRDSGSSEVVNGTKISVPTGNYTLNPGSKTYNFKHNYNLQFATAMGLTSAENQNIYLLKLRTLLNDLPETVGAQIDGSNFPSQGKKLESTGSSGNSLRKIEVFELYPDLPGFFDSAITSAGGITK